MSRDVAAHHHPAVLRSPHAGWALALHRVAPTLSLVELLERAGEAGPARRAIEHARECADCGVGQLCETGEKLAKKITGRRKRSWLALRAADVAQARARKRKGAA